ncbi:MAG TPA: adenylate/guanylate cyclase domain-containing protein, partial [Marmoricola sp.]|nr:adenylate/guanylate cyclase domain-containing protein [Marmoricola sp.]
MTDNGPAIADRIQGVLLGEEPHLTRRDLVEQSGVGLEVAETLWRLLGFPHVDDSEVAFTAADLEALQLTKDLMDLGVLGPDSQAALVRTLARSFARLAEWQTRLLAEIGEAVEISDDDYVSLVADVTPRIETLQNYVWRRHLASASASRLTTEEAGDGTHLAICFVDIVGYTSRSKELDEAELIDWVERFEADVSGVVVDHGGQVIKTIGDEVLFVLDDPREAVEVGLILTARGSDSDDAFPAVRVGIAYGNVVRRLGDVFGPTVNIAARLTSVGRPGTVIVDQGVHDLLCREHAPEATRAEDITLRRLPRTSVKGY